MALALQKENEKENGKNERLNMELYLCEFVAAKNVTI